MALFKKVEIETIEEESPQSFKEIKNLKGIDGYIYNLEIFKYYDSIKFRAEIIDDLTEIKYSNNYTIKKLQSINEILSIHFKSIDNTYEYFNTFNPDLIIISKKNETINIEYPFKSLNKDDKITLILNQENYNIKKIIQNFNNKFIELSDLNKKINKLCEAVEQQNNINEEKKIKNLNEINERINELSVKIGNQEEINKTSKELNIDKIKNKINELEIKLENQKKIDETNNMKEINELNEKLNNLYHKLEKQKNRIKENTNIKALHSKIDELNKNIELQNDIKVINMKIDNFYINNEEQKKKNEENLKNEIRGVNKKIQNLTEFIEKNKVENEEKLKNEISGVNEKIKQLRENVNVTINKQREDRKKEIDKLISTVNNLDKELRNKIDEIDNSQIKNILKGKIKHFDIELKKLKDNIFPYILFEIFLFSLIFIPKILIAPKISSELSNFFDFGNYTDIKDYNDSFVFTDSDNYKDIKDFNDSFVFIDFNNYKNIINKGIKHNFNTTIKSNSLLFLASRDGFLADDFHRICDGKSFTVTVVMTNKGKIFGGFTDKTWDGVSGYVSGDKGFIFSLNKDKIYYNKDKSKNIFCNKNYGPNFGYNDFVIKNKSNERLNIDKSGFEYAYETYGKRYVLAGTSGFYVKDYAVFQLTLE